MVTKSGSSLLASRRLADNPKAACIRSVTGLVLAVSSWATIVAGLLPAVNATTATPSAERAETTCCWTGFTAALVCGNNVRLQFGRRRPKTSCRRPWRAVQQSYERAENRTGRASPAGWRQAGEPAAGLLPWHAMVIPLYSMAQDGNPATLGANNAIVSCGGLRQLAVLGQCAPGDKAVEANTYSLFSDNPTFSTQLSIAGPVQPGGLAAPFFRPVPAGSAGEGSNSPAALEKSPHVPGHPSGRQSASGTAPRTFGEAVQAGKCGRHRTAAGIYFGGRPDAAGRGLQPARSRSAGAWWSASGHSLCCA